MASTPAMSRTTRLAVRLVAAKQDLVNMGFPEIIAKLLYERYGNLAPLIAKWYKDYHASGERGEDPDWWRRQYSFTRSPSLQSLTHVYEAGVDPESMRQVGEHEDMGLDFWTQGEVDEFRQSLVHDIREKLFKDVFFTYSTLMQDINSGKLKDVAPYKKMKFRDATMKYDERRHFTQTQPLKVYDNGFKWIDTGKKSVVLAEQMSNCGSAGVMSSDENRTILALFGPTNKPHVMVTYSPNQKRISGDECAGSSPVKPEYHPYVLDLANHLGAKFDVSRTKSPELGLKYQLRNKAQSIELVQENKYGDSYFKFVSDGQEFYTDGRVVVSGGDMERIRELFEQGGFGVEKDAYRAGFSGVYRDWFVEQGIRFTPIQRFVEEDEVVDA